MKKWFTARKERKEKIVQQVKQDKAALKLRKEELKELPEAERKQAKLIDKQDKQAQRQAFKENLKQLDKKERGQQKKDLKMYRKIKHRPRRAVGWSIAILLVLFIIINFGSTASDMYTTMSGKGIELTTNTTEGKQARIAGEELSEKIADEGIVLLKNEEGSLPLKDKKINIFGVSSFNFRYGGGGSGGSDTSRALSIYHGLEEAGISYNENLYDFYKKMPELKDTTGKSETGIMAIVKAMTSKDDSDEPKIDYLPDDILKEAKKYSSNALITITSSGVESSDMSPSQLKITKNMQELIKKVTADFENVTIVVNAGNTLELGFLDDFPEIKSILWVGTPGPYGTRSLGNILAGTINPSGRVTDTYAYEVASAPAAENFGNYSYGNLDKDFVNYQEGIYIGYRFYETYYLNDEKGYQKAVQFPYGYGLSYTDFDWKITDKKLTDETISLKVEVTNTGKAAGKDVVQLYYSAPYYEGQIEKAAIELGAYKKTQVLQPNEKETMELTFATNDMASYDMNDEEAYVLDKGTYEIHLAKNVHDVVETVEYTNKERKVMNEDSVTGAEIKNQFDKSSNDLTYLSRADWQGTYPSDKNINDEAPQFVLDELNKEVKPSNLAMPAFDEDQGIKLEELKGLDYDDPKWSDFLAQFSVEELMDFYTQGAYKTNAVKRLGVPNSVLLDGPAGINFFFKTIEAASYPSEIVLASTWNDQLAYDMGEAVGKEARALGVHGWYAPAMNVHRTALGGRNFEYFSEDPLLSGKMASAITKGAQDQDVVVFMKHFAMNDQETNARSGLYVWANEQAIREVHLKPFEITVKEGETLGAMSSFSYINGQWSGGNSILLNDVLRDEWGFEGMVSSDAVFGFMHADKAVVSGNDLMLDIMSPTKNKQRLKEAYKKDPAGVGTGLQTSAHNVLYALLHTHLFE